MSYLSEFWTLLTQFDAEKIKLVAEQNTWIALLLCFASGILTSLTPCIYPMVPITINIFGRAARNRKDGGAKRGARFDPHTFKLALIYVGGMCFTYSVMGLVAGLTGSLFGKVLQSPFFLLFLTLLFLVLAIGQFGLFKLQLPPSLQTKLARKGNAESKIGIFLMGLFSGLIVSPCVGPVIAGILAFVFDTSNAFRGFIYFLSFSMGLGVLFLVIGGFSGMLAKLPRSGAWMTRVNAFLAALMLIAAGYYGSLFAKQIGWLSGAQKATFQTEKLYWLSDETEALRVAKAKQLPIVIDFSAEWCEACHVLDATVFQHPDVVPHLQSVVLLRFDVTEDSAQNEEKLRKFGVLSLPTIVFLDRNQKLMDKPRVNGVIPYTEFLEMLKGL